MNTSPLISIIMPAYQAEDTLEQSVRSIMLQSLHNWELILLVDAATDNTIPLAVKMAADDKRIRLAVSKRNRGVVRTRNIGLRLARGSYLAFCDADDFWIPAKLETQLKLLRSSTSNFCYTSARYVRVDLNWESAPARMPSQLDLKRLLKGNPIGMSTVLMDLSVTGKFYFKALPSPYVHEDYAYWVDLFRKKEIRTVYWSEATTRVSIHQNTRSGNKWLALRSQWYILRHIADCHFLESTMKILSYILLALYKRGFGTIVKQFY